MYYIKITEHTIGTKGATGFRYEVGELGAGAYFARSVRSFTNPEKARRAVERSILPAHTEYVSQVFPISHQPAH